MMKIIKVVFDDKSREVYSIPANSDLQAELKGIAQDEGKEVARAFRNGSLIYNKSSERL